MQQAQPNIDSESLLGELAANYAGAFTDGLGCGAHRVLKFIRRSQSKLCTLIQIDPFGGGYWAYI